MFGYKCNKCNIFEKVRKLEVTNGGGGGGGGGGVLDLSLGKEVPPGPYYLDPVYD